MATVSWHSLPAMFFEQAERFREKPFLWAKQDGVYRPITWGETAERVKQLARGLQAMGLQKGDRLVLVSENRPEWLIADLAVMSAGAITVPAFTTNTVADHLHILTHSGAKAAIVSPRFRRRCISEIRSSRGQPVSGIPNGFRCHAPATFASRKPCEHESFSRGWQMMQ